MNCDDLRDSFELYSLGLLDGDEKREIEEHLGRDCAACQQSFKDALGLNAVLMSQAQQVVPPSRLRRRVLASVGMERAGWGWAAALVAGCSVIAVLWLGIENRTRDLDLTKARLELKESVAERDRLEQAFTFLNQPETRQVNFGQGQPAPPRGNFFLNPSRGILLIASNLPALPAGRAYEMWVIPKGSAPVPAGLFRSGAQGTAMHIRPGPVDSNVTLAVTIEPESGSPAPTSGILFSAGF